MGKLLAAKKSRGHYAAKKKAQLDKSCTPTMSGLETITLHTNAQSFTNSARDSASVKSKANKTSTGKLPTVPISNELVKKNDVSPSIEDCGTAESAVKKGAVTKKNRRAARRRQWIKKLSNFQPPDKTEVRKEKFPVNDMQSLANALPSLQETSHKKKKSRFTKKSLDAEIKNFVQVLEHPAFKNDPLGTIELHLTNARKRGLI